MFWSIISFFAGLLSGAGKLKHWASGKISEPSADDTDTVAKAKHAAKAAAEAVTATPSPTPAPGTPMVNAAGQHYAYAAGQVQQAAPTTHHVVMWLLLTLLVLITIRALFGPDWWKLLPGVPARLARAHGQGRPAREYPEWASYPSYPNYPGQPQPQKRDRPLTSGEKAVTHDELYQAVSEAVGPAVDIAIRRQLRDSALDLAETGGRR